MTESIKEKAVDFARMFGAALALEFYQADILEITKEFCAPHTPESWKQLIHNTKPFIPPSSFFDAMAEYKSFIKDYTTERLAEKMLELIYEVRPDLSDIILSSPEEGTERAWFYRCIEMIRDRIVNPERYMEELEKAQMVKVTCESCGKSWRIFKENAEEIKQCPFCAGGEGKTKP